MTIVHDTIAQQVAELEQLVPTPAPPFAYGVDLSCVQDCTATFDEVDPRSQRAIGEAVVRRLSTARDTMPDDTEYGLDLRSYMNRGRSLQEIADLAGAVRNEITKDDRIESATVTATFAGTTLLVQVTITPVNPDTGTFRLTLAVTSAEVLLEALRMTISLEALITPLSRQEVEASIYQVLAAIGVNTTTWKPGAVVRTMIVGVSVVLSSLSQLQALIARSGFLEHSEGDWLTLLAHHVYNVDRLEATFAEGEVTLTNTGGGVFSLDIDDMVVSNPDTGKTYRNTEAFSLGALATLTIAIKATEAGSASTSLPDSITALETTMLGVTVTNAEAVVGRDAELDPDVRTRCSEKLGALSPMGPWDAYASAARNARRVDGTPVGVTRVRQLKDGAGGVTTWVATATGAVLGDPDDPDTDLGAVNEAVQQLAAPLAVTAVVASATPLVLAITYEAWAYNTSGLTDSQLRDLIAAKLSTFTSAQPIGGAVIGLDPGKVFLSLIIAAIASARPEIFRIEIALPADDLELDIDEVPVLGTVSGTIHQVPPAELF